MSWVKQNGSGSQHANGWVSITSSSNGNYIYAHEGNTIYKSSDGGFTWTNPTTDGSHGWINLSATTTTTSDSIGKYLIAGTGDEVPVSPYISTDFGVTMTEVTAITSTGWDAVATSYDGTNGRYVACSYGGSIYTSSNGTSWTTESPAVGDWISASISETAT